jgi:hypothetical protein
MASSTSDADAVNVALKNALTLWQGNPIVVKRAADVMGHVMWQCTNLSWDPVVHFCTLMMHLESEASILRVGKIMWHAAPNGVNIGKYMQPLLSTSRTREAAEAFGNRNFTHGFTVHKIVVASRGMRGIDVNAMSGDVAYAHEQEILVKLFNCELIKEDNKTYWKLKAWG